MVIRLALFNLFKGKEEKQMKIKGLKKQWKILKEQTMAELATAL